MQFTKRPNIKKTTKERLSPFRELVSIYYKALNETLTKDQLDDRLKSLNKQMGKTQN